MSALAGTLGERVTIERRGAERDALGGAAGEWAEVATLWAAVAPLGVGAGVVGEAVAAMMGWDVTIRAADVAMGDRLRWRGRVLRLTAIRVDPRAPDRLVLSAREERQ